MADQFVSVQLPAKRVKTCSSSRPILLHSSRIQLERIKHLQRQNKYVYRSHHVGCVRDPGIIRKYSPEVVHQVFSQISRPMTSFAPRRIAARHIISVVRYTCRSYAAAAKNARTMRDVPIVSQRDRIIKIRRYSPYVFSSYIVCEQFSRKFRDNRDASSRTVSRLVVASRYRPRPLSLSPFL